MSNTTVSDEVTKKLFGNKKSTKSPRKSVGKSVSKSVSKRVAPVKLKFVLKKKDSGSDRDSGNERGSNAKKAKSPKKPRSPSNDRILRTEFADDPQIGKIKSVPIRELNKLYTIGRKLGEGGFGEAFLATHIPSGRTVVLKKSLDKIPFWSNALHDAENEVMFLKDFTTKTSCHPNIICYYDAFIDADSIVDDVRTSRSSRSSHSCDKKSHKLHRKGTFCIVMEHVKGKDLLDLIRQKLLTDELILYMSEDLLNGLNAIHCKGILHNDIKPENILFDLVIDEVRLIDFGFACFRGNQCEAGTEQYFAPEVGDDGLGQRIDERTDIYALGLTIAMMALRGKYNPEDITRDIIRNKVQNKQIRDLCLDMLESKKPDRLYADELLEKHFDYVF